MKNFEVKKVNLYSSLTCILNESRERVASFTMFTMIILILAYNLHIVSFRNVMFLSLNNCYELINNILRLGKLEKKLL